MSKLNNKVFLITGGAGFIGSHLVDKLLALGAEKVVCVDNLFLGKKENLEGANSHKNFIFHKQDASNYKKMKEICEREGTDVCFDMATISLPASLVDPAFCVKEIVNIADTQCNLTKDGHYGTLVHFSSSEVYGSSVKRFMSESHPLNPHTPYAAAKAGADHLVDSYGKTFGIDYTIVRPFNNYGPRQNKTIYAAVIPITIQRILSGQPPIIEWDGRQSRDFSFVTDTADAAIRLYLTKKSRGKTINVGSGRETTIEELISAISSLLGYNGEIIRKPKRPGDVRRHCGNISLAKKLIGYKPKTGFAEGLGKTIEFYKTRA